MQSTGTQYALGDFKSRIELGIDYLIYGQISSFCPDRQEGKLSTLIMPHKVTQKFDRRTVFIY